MTEFDDKIEEETTMNVPDRLPELDEEETSTALENVRWAAGFVGTPQGSIYNDAGVDLQVVATRTVRCLAVADHPYCYRALAMMAIDLLGDDAAEAHAVLAAHRPAMSKQTYLASQRAVFRAEVYDGTQAGDAA